MYLLGTTDLPPAGEHVLTGELEGYTIVTDEAGIITEVMAPEAEAAPAPVLEESAVDAEASTRQIEALATSVRSMQDVLTQILDIQKSNSEDLRSIKSTPFGKQVFPGGSNRVTSQRGAAVEAETEWARQQRIINEKKAYRAS